MNVSNHMRRVAVSASHSSVRRLAQPLRGAALTCAIFSLAACGGSGGGRTRGVVGVSGVLVDTNRAPDVVEVDLEAVMADVEILPGKTTRMMTYNGLFPGPLLEAKAGDRILVHFTNHIGDSTTIHWHGVRLSDQMDGSPRVQYPVEDGQTFTYDFVAPEGSTFWYHPHVRTNVQVEHGLYAPIIVRDPLDPSYDHERMVVLDDVLMDTSTGAIADPFLSSEESRSGRLGNVLLTNGRPSEQATGVAREGEVERWRLLDSANARSMQLRLTGPAHFRVIATDGGLLQTPYTTDEIVFGPGMRFDIEVSYDGPGDVQLESYAALPEADGGVSAAWRAVYRVTVAGTGRTARVIPWPAVPAIPDRALTRVASFDLESTIVPDVGIEWTINGMAAPDTELYRFELGDTVGMTVRNLSGFDHPFHLHGQFFTIQDGGTPYTQQPGLKDTVLVPPLSTVRLTGFLDNPGRWMIHCHNLEHATLGMMGEITVGDAGVPIDAHIH